MGVSRCYLLEGEIFMFLLCCVAWWWLSTPRGSVFCGVYWDVGVKVASYYGLALNYLLVWGRWGRDGVSLGRGRLQGVTLLRWCTWLTYHLLCSFLSYSSSPMDVLVIGCVGRRGKFCYARMNINGEGLCSCIYVFLIVFLVSVLSGHAHVKVCILLDSCWSSRDCVAFIQWVSLLRDPKYSCFSQPFHLRAETASVIDSYVSKI